VPSSLQLAAHDPRQPSEDFVMIRLMLRLSLVGVVAASIAIRALPLHGDRVSSSSTALPAGARLQAASSGAKDLLRHAAPPPVLAPFRLRSRPGRRTRGCIYARFSTRFQNSIEDQVRACLAWAAANEIDIDEEVHVFVDRGKSGRTHKRAGFQTMLRALERDEVDVVITFATNRLFRKMYQSLRFAEEEIVSRQKRVAFIAQGIDTAKTEFWRQLLSVYAMLDELQISSMAAFVRAAHEGLLDKELVHGTLTFGYRGDVVAGELTRRNKPKRTWAMDEECAEWVRRIFQWFTHERLPAAAIARRLNRSRAPLPPRCQSGQWTELAVKVLLRNRRYIGDFAYGRKEAVWQAKQGYSRQFTREVPLKEKRIERLRLVDDATFHAAQARLAQFAGRGGRRRRAAGDDEASPHFVRELLWCPRHERYLGTFGRGWAFVACKRELRRAAKDDDAAVPADALYSQVDPELAVRALCTSVAALLRNDDEFASMVRNRFRAVAEQLQAPDPGRVDALRREVESWTLKIDAAYDFPAATEADRAEQRKHVAAFQRERAAVQRQLDEAEAAAGQQLLIPTPDEIRARVGELQRILVEAATSADAVARADARAIVADVTGGRVEMTQQGEPVAKRGWLCASFMPYWVTSFADVTLPQGADEGKTGAAKVEVQLRTRPAYDDLADKVMRQVDAGHLLAEIAATLKVSRRRVARAYRFWYESRGLAVPDGRTRRSGLVKKHRVRPTYQAVADDVMVRHQQGMLLHEIADVLGLDRNTVTSSVAWWHEQKGLAVPDGRARRKTLAIKSRTSRSRRPAGPRD
jgi:DNA invertase Pin-like site-specific DNA recombinase